MEKEKKKGKGLIVLILLLIIIIIGLIGYICYDKGIFDNLLGRDKSIEEAKKANTEPLVEGYQFRLKDLNCEKGEYSCTKKLKAAYNERNHDIEIKYYQKIEDSPHDNPGIKQNSLYFELYIDSVLIDTIDSGYLYLNPENQTYDSEYNMDFDGYIYVFDGKYLGFLLQTQYPAGSPGYSLVTYANEKRVGDITSIDSAGQSFGKNGSEMDGIDNIKFDGTSLEYWRLACNNRETALKLSLTFDGTNYKINVLDKINGITGGGSAECYDVENNRYGG